MATAWEAGYVVGPWQPGISSVKGWGTGQASLGSQGTRHCDKGLSSGLGGPNVTAQGLARQGQNLLSLPDAPEVAQEQRPPPQMAILGAGNK
jgi:hypothetical protein